jgi:hypothetical protein
MKSSEYIATHLNVSPDIVSRGRDHGYSEKEIRP